MPMTPLPTLDRTSATFKTDVDDFFATDLPLFVTEANTLETNVVNKEASAVSAASTATTKAAEATTKAAEAAASAMTAVSAANATTWVSGTTYALHDVVFSPADNRAYIRIVAGAGTTDPSADGTNWTLYPFDVSGDTTPQLGGHLDAQQNKITNLGDATQADDALTLAQAQATALSF